MQFRTSCVTLFRGSIVVRVFRDAPFIAAGLSLVHFEDRGTFLTIVVTLFHRYTLDTVDS